MTSSRDAVWAALAAVEEWPSWWRWLKRIDVVRAATAPNGVGAVYRNDITSPTGYGFTFHTETAAAEPLRRIDLTLTGDIVGRIRYVMSDAPSGGTHVAYAQLVETPKWWMNLLAPIARPGFNWNHDKLMTDFGKGLATASGGELVSVRNWTLKPSAPGFYEMPALRELTRPLIGLMEAAGAGDANLVARWTATAEARRIGLRVEGGHRSGGTGDVLPSCTWNERSASPSCART